MTRSLMLLLASLSASIPLAIDAYLPAMPQMADYFSTSIHDIELSLSLFLGSFALGQLIGGPFSDHIGRRISVLSGLSLFCLGTIGVIFSNSVEALWACRILQAFGGGLAAVNTTATIRDLTEGKETAKQVANVMIIMLLAPLLAPVIGTVLLHFGDWHLIFECILAYAMLLGVTLYFKLPETRKVAEVRQHFLSRYWQVVSHRMALGFIASQGLAMAAMFAFITASPFVYMEFFGISTALYPFFFGANVVIIMLFNRINVLLLRFYEPENILTAGQLLQLLLGLLLFLYVIGFETLNPYVFAVIVMLFIGMNGLVVSNAGACTVGFFPTNAATATALSGAFGFAAGSISGTLVGLLGDGTAWPMAFVMFISACIALILRALLHRRAIVTVA